MQAFDTTSVRRDRPNHAVDSSLQSDTSQISYPAQQDGSGGEEEEEEEDAFTEPLQDYPRYRKLQDLNR